MTDAEAFILLRRIVDVGFPAEREALVDHFDGRIRGLRAELVSERIRYQTLDEHCERVQERLGQVKSILNSTVT